MQRESMADFGTFGDVYVDIGDEYVATVELRRGPNNFFDISLITSIADAFEALDTEPRCRAIVLCSEGKHFCAGANFGNEDHGLEDGSGRHLYDEAVRLFSTRKPAVAAVQGAAVGGGLGLALMPDFRVASAESRFSSNFARLGFHQGFGLSVTLPDLVGQQRAMEMLYIGRRIPGDEAFSMGLCDRLVASEQIRAEALAFATEIAISGPLAIASIRRTLRGGLAERIRVATDREKAEQDRLQNSEDFQEGIRAMADRRKPDFRGR